MIGKRIRFIRKKRNMTMKYLGMAVGLPENSADIRISQYETFFVRPLVQRSGYACSCFFL